MTKLWLTQLLLLLLAPTLLAQAGNQESKPLYASDLSSMAAGTKTTYLDLVRRIIPDLQIDPRDAAVAIGHKTIRFRHLPENTKPSALESDIKLDSFQPYWIKSDGRR